jgi:glycosyltransferase involved in cell wall biosynthesis
MLLAHINFAKGFRGGERQTQLLIEQLAQLGLKQKLLVRKGSQLTKRCQKIENLEIIEIAKPYILHLKHITNATLLHAHETKAAQFAYFANRLTAIPYIITRRVDNPIKNNFLNKKIYSNAAVVVALSRAIKDEILKVAPNAVVEVIPSAFTDAAINEEKSALIKKRFKGKYLIGNVGALDDGHKGQSHLIKVAKELEKSHPNIHFIFVGSGQDEEKLKTQAQGLNNVTFEGFVNNVNDYINSFDLFVFPSNNEGLGSILLDVMQLSVPIVASNVGGIPDIIIDNKNGLLTPPANSDALKQKILDLYADKEKSSQLASAAKTNIEKFSPSAMRDSYFTIYQKIEKGL